MVSLTRAAAFVIAVASLCGCVAQGAHTTAASSASASPTAVPAPAGPANALVSAVGTPGAIPLDTAQRQALARALGAAPAALRPRLRYALAAGDDGQRRLVVYDGGGLPADGHHPGKKFEYVVFKILNSSRGEHYDPQQNAVIAAIPSADRDSATEAVPAAK